MGIEQFFVTPMTIRRPATTTDRYNNEALDWTSATETVVNGWLNELSSFESLGNRDTTSQSVQVFLPADAPITSGDRVAIGGVMYEVDGTPSNRHTPNGPHHIEATLRVFDDARGAV